MEIGRKKNATTTLNFPLLDSADPKLLKSGAGTPDSEYSIDGANFIDCSNEISEIQSTGQYELDLLAAETNGTIIVILVKTTDAITQVIIINTDNAGLWAGGELYRVKNASTTIYFPMWDSSGPTALKSGAAGLDSEYSVDGGNFTDCASEATEIQSSGIYKLDLAAGEVNGNLITIQIKSSDALTQTIIINTQTNTGPNLGEMEISAVGATTVTFKLTVIPSGTPAEAKIKYREYEKTGVNEFSYSSAISNPAVDDTKQITGLTAGKLYEFIPVFYDSAGNEGTDGNIIRRTPLLV